MVLLRPVCQHYQTIMTSSLRQCRFTSAAAIEATQIDVCFVPIADIPSVSTYRTDFSSNVFYKPTPYWPVCSVSSCALVKQQLAAISKISQRRKSASQ